MKENGKNQPQPVRLPPAWCSAICRNAMNESCIEGCAIRRDCSGFEPKEDLTLEKLPLFPLKESREMTKEEKFTAVTIYLAKVVDHLKGKETNGYPVRTRPYPNSQGRGPLPPDVQVQDILLDFPEADTPSEAGEERPNPPVGSD